MWCHTLQGAIAEAAFMTGLERNSEVVEMAAYAPLFVHAEQGTWVPTWPTNLIVFDSSRCATAGAPSWLLAGCCNRQRVLHQCQPEPSAVASADDNNRLRG